MDNKMENNDKQLIDTDSQNINQVNNQDDNYIISNQDDNNLSENPKNQDLTSKNQENVCKNDDKSLNDTLSQDGKIGLENENNSSNMSPKISKGDIEVAKLDKSQQRKDGYNQIEKVFDESKVNPDSFSDKKIEEFKDEVRKGKSKKKKIINLLFFILNIIIVAGILVYNILNESGDSSPFNFKDINPLFFGLYVLLILVTLMLDVFVIVDLVKKATGKFRFNLAFKSFSIMRYYDNITPMSVGGQPFMVSYLVHHEVSGSSSLSIPMKKFIVQQLAWSLVCLVGLICSFVLHLLNNPIIYIFSIIGFTINFGLILFILFGSTSRKLVRNIAFLGLKLASKLHLVKNYKKNLKKVLTFINEYNAIMKEFSSNKFEFIKLFLMQLIRQILYFSIPFAIYCMFETPTFELFYTFFVFTVMVDLASSCCPLPGGTGMNEITFSVLFASYLPSQVFWALLLWRLASYYIWLILGLIILVYDFFVGNKKNQKTIAIHKLRKEKSNE